MTILGRFRAERPPASPEPVVHARVALTPGRVVRVTFPIDTGADRTMLNPQDTAAVLPDPNSLDWENDPTLGAMQGVGEGVCRIITRQGVIGFRDDQIGPALRAVSSGLVEPTDSNRQLPSLLVRDVLESFRLTVSTRESQVTLELV